MYMIADMVDLPKQKWPSSAHRTVAVNLATCNPRVSTLDALAEVCRAVASIPITRIKTVTPAECAAEFQVPYI